LVVLLGLGLACSPETTTPRRGGDDGTRLANQFDQLADSVEAGGYSPAADALRHAGEIARLTGHATPVSVTIDGAARNFLAVAEQIDFPNLVCSWPVDSGVTPPDTVPEPPPDTGNFPPPPRPPDSTGVPPIDSGGVVPPDSGRIPVDSLVMQSPPDHFDCHAEGTYSMRTLIAWEPEHMKEVVRLVAYIGSSGVEPGVPDVMTGLPNSSAASAPPSAPPDSGSGSGGEPGGFPGFMGEYLVRDVGRWYAIAGAQTNDIVAAGGECSAENATVDWAEFECSAARYRFEFSMNVRQAGYGIPTLGLDDPPPGPEGNHILAMDPSEIDGVRLTWLSWTPPSFPPDSVPADQ
jgi:hypothetical protein